MTPLSELMLLCFNEKPNDLHMSPHDEDVLAAVMCASVCSVPALSLITSPRLCSDPARRQRPHPIFKHTRILAGSDEAPR